MKEATSFVVVIVGEAVDGTPVCSATPYWDCLNSEMPAAVASCVVAHCNKHGNGEFDVVIRPISN